MSLIIYILIRQIKLHTKAVRQCALMLDNLEIMLNYNRLSINELFMELSNSGLYDLLPFIDNFKGFYEDSDSLRINDIKYLDKQDKEQLTGFFSLLGKSHIDGQIQNCRIYKTYFNKKMNLLENEESKKCKIVSVLTFGFFALILIVFI